MQRRYSLLAMAAWVALAATSCGSEEAVSLSDTRPDAPTLGTEAAVMFDVTLAGQSSKREIALLNEGKADLVFDTIAVEDDAGNVFKIESVSPDAKTAAAGRVVAVLLSFKPSAKGVALAKLHLTSNAAAASDVTIELIGPAAGTSRVSGPEMLPFEAVAKPIVLGAANDQTMLPARFVNIGRGALDIIGYSLTGQDAAAFEIDPAARMPTTDNPVHLLGGAWVGVGVFYKPASPGSHQAAFQVRYIDPADSQQTPLTKDIVLQSGT